jgi:Fe-S cluster assembly protein SufB
MIVNGFCRHVFVDVPLEFGVEALNVLAVRLEGEVG